MSTDWLEISEGNAPLVLSIPHTGLTIPDEIAQQLQCDKETALADTDWWVDKLYSFAPELGITVVRSHISRTVIDLNRDPSGVSLYPGQTTTQLCPQERFDGVPFYAAPLSEEETEYRKATWFMPYHNALSHQLNRLKRQHGRVVLFDAHSIRSLCPRLFEGELPGLNLGTNTDKSCHSDYATIAFSALQSSVHSAVSNGRFKGGWITRHYGNPEQGIHALQLEIAQRCYLREPAEPGRPEYDAAYAAPLQNELKQLLSRLIDRAKS